MIPSLCKVLCPAENLNRISDCLATVTAPDDQLSLAIGRGGQNVRLAAKLTGYQITITSASGLVKSQVTGKEEHEIDTFEGIEPETRTMLIENKLTTVSDLSRFRDKWMGAKELSMEQKEMLMKRVEDFDAAEKLADKNRLTPRL
jgi:N utilization substance protein A